MTMSHSSRAATALALVLAAQTASAQSRCDEALVPQPAGCARENADIVVTMPTGDNAELVDTLPGAGFGTTGFSISIDGETVAGAPAPADPRRPADIAADAAEVDVRFDGLDRRRFLNVSTTDLRAAYRAGEVVTFRTSANYPVFIDRAEIRIIDPNRRGRPVVAVLPAAPNGEIAWEMPAEGPGELAYVLRVYDAAGRFDETDPLDLARTTRAFETHETTGAVIAAGEGEDRTRIRNIPLRGGLVTASGTGAAPGGTVTVMGEPVPVDAGGRFVTSRILPAGDHVVIVDVNGRRIVRDVTIPASEWFYVGIADLTFGRRFEDELAEADPDFEEFYAEGRPRPIPATAISRTSSAGSTTRTRARCSSGSIPRTDTRPSATIPRPSTTLRPRAGSICASNATPRASPGVTSRQISARPSSSRKAARSMAPNFAMRRRR